MIDKPKVIIVDDSLTVRMDLEEAMLDANFEPVCFADLSSCRHFLETEIPAIIILDVLLPDGDGVDFLAELKANPRTSEIPILLLSTEAEVGHRVRGLKSGAADYVGKPYDRNYVTERSFELIKEKTEPITSRAAPLVLLIDDSITFREVMSREMQSIGLEVRTAESGEQGLRMASQLRPDAIVVDGMLPGIDGATVVRRLRSDAVLRRVPCLLLTGSDTKKDELVSLDAGADTYLNKESHMSVILARLTALLRTATDPADFKIEQSLFGPKRILAVDDSPTFLHELSEVLKNEKYEVIQARSGEEALELLSFQTVDCILLDFLMPGLAGDETCRQIKSQERLRDIPVVVLTSKKEQDTILDCLSAGADDFVPKSSEFELLKARVRAQLRRKQFEEENRLTKEVTATIRKNETMLRALFEFAPDAVVVADRNGRIVRANGQAEAIFGYTRTELLDRNVEMLVPRRLRSDFDRHREEFLKQHKLQLIDANSGAWALRKDGTEFPVDVVLGPVQTDEGTLVVATVREVTERKRLEDQERQTKQELLLLNDLLQQSTQPFAVADLRGHLIRWNRAFSKLTGYDDHELSTLTPDVLSPDQWHKSDAEAINRLLATRDAVRYEKEYRCKDGMIIPVELKVDVYCGESGDPECFFAFVSDITDRREAQAALNAKEEEVREVSRQLWQATKLATMGELAASIAHELNNPLATVGLRAESILDQLSSDSPARRDVAIIEQEVQRMATLVSNLLQFTRAGESRFSTIDICQEINQTLELIYHHLRKRNINVVQEFTDDSLALFADRAKIRQLHINLMVNASDAMPDGGTLTIRVQGDVLPDGRPVVVQTISDTGVGIPENIISQVMNPFFTTKAEGSGTGLGLAICKRIVDEHHGTIEITSEVGVGTTFRVSLPSTNGQNCSSMML